MSRMCRVLRLTDERASRHGPVRPFLEDRQMSNATSTASGTSFPRLLRSTGAIVVGFLSVAVLSLATDQVLHVAGVYPPWGEPMYDTSLNLLALSYRTLYTILGGYITATMAPHAPMRHVLVVAVLGSVVATAGAIAAIRMAESRSELVPDCAGDYGGPVRVAWRGAPWGPLTNCPGTSSTDPWPSAPTCGVPARKVATRRCPRP